MTSGRYLAGISKLEINLRKNGKVIWAPFTGVENVRANAVAPDEFHLIFI